MVQITYLLSAALMGLFLLAVVVLANRYRTRSYSIQTRREVEREEDYLMFANRLVRNPTTWVVAFLVLVVGFVAGAVAFLGGVSVPEPSRQLIWLAVAGGLAVLLSLYLGVGLYLSARSRGHKSAQAAGVAVIALGFLFLGAVTVKLLVGG